MANGSDTNGREEVSVSGLGFASTFKGKDIVHSVVMFLVLVVFGYLLYQQHEAQNGRFDSITVEMKKANELQYLQSWIMSKPQEARPRLSLPPQMWKYLDESPPVGNVKPTP